MNTTNLFRWFHPGTWSWLTWVWVTSFVIGVLREGWEWFRRKRAKAWPTAQGLIEGVTVRRKEQFPIRISHTPRGRPPVFIAELSYSYSLSGEHHWGFYGREFHSEEEGWDFVRDLKGTSVVVSFSPREHDESTLSEEAVGMLLKIRPPAAKTNLGEIFVVIGSGWR